MATNSKALQQVKKTLDAHYSTHKTRSGTVKIAHAAMFLRLRAWYDSQAQHPYCAPF